MPHEVKDFRPVMRYLERCSEQGLMLARSLAKGPRSGFAVIVDDETDVRAVMLVERPDWKRPHAGPTRLQVDAVETRSAVSLLSWVPWSAHLQVYTYRPWLQELVACLMEPQVKAHRVHCLARPRQFHPSPLGKLAREITADSALRAEAEARMGAKGADRLFGIVRDDRLVACAALARPDGDYVTIQSAFTQEEERGQGLGAAVLSAATAAGLADGRVVSYGFPVSDIPSLHMVADLGFTPTCREWVAEGCAGA